MKRLVLTSLSAALLTTSVQASFLCDKPVEAVCGKAALESAAASMSTGSRKIENSIRKEVISNLKTFNADQLTDAMDNLTFSSRVLGEVRETLIRSQKLINKRLAQAGISKADLLAAFAETKNAIKNGLEHSKAKSTSENFDEIQNSLTRAEFITPEYLEKASGKELDSLTRAFYSECEVDGLNPGAAYSPKHGVIILCPGTMLRALEERSTMPLTFVLAHEAAHFVSADKNETVAKNYKSLAECLRVNYGNNFKRLVDLCADIDKSCTPKLTAEIAALEESKPQDRDLLERIKYMVQFNDSLKQHWDPYDSNLRNSFKNFTPHPSLNYLDEISADTLAQFAISKKLSSLPASKREQAFISQVKIFCPLLHVGKQGDSGVHPTVPFRIEQMLRNPSIREALSCKPETWDSKPWCGMDGAVGGKAQPQAEAPTLNATPSGSVRAQ